MPREEEEKQPRAVSWSLRKYLKKTRVALSRKVGSKKVIVGFGMLEITGGLEQRRPWEREEMRPLFLHYHTPEPYSPPLFSRRHPCPRVVPHQALLTSPPCCTGLNVTVPSSRCCFFMTRLRHQAPSNLSRPISHIRDSCPDDFSFLK